VAITYRRFETTYPSPLQWSRSPGRIKCFPVHAKRQKRTEEIVPSILNLGARCRCVVTVLLCSRERVAGTGTHCVGPVAVRTAFMGILGEKKFSVPVTSLTTNHWSSTMQTNHYTEYTVTKEKSTVYQILFTSNFFTIILFFIDSTIFKTCSKK